MQGNNQNNYKSWREKLDALDTIPGSSVEPNNAMWTKLHGRLTETTSGSPKIIWYAIAASLAFIFGLLFIYETYKQPETASATKNSNANKKDIILTQTTTGLPQKKNAVVTNITAQHPQQMLANRHSIYKSVPPLLKPESVLILTAITNNTPTLQPTGAEIDKITKSSKPAIASISMKPKLKVVHINELNDIPQQSYYSKQQHEITSSAIGYINSNTSKTFKENNSHFIVSIPLKN